jgi:signal transduction histidine kinase
MKQRVIFNYRVFVWVLLALAIVMGCGLIIIAYTNKLQKNTEKEIEMARQSVSIAKELEIQLFSLRNFTFNYLVDKSQVWIDSINTREKDFIIYLERARSSVNSQEESTLILQISALFSNFEQNLNRATQLAMKGDISKANALIAHSAKDLLGTIHQKTKLFININQRFSEEQRKTISKINALIFRIMIILGIGGVIVGLFIGWLISRMLFAPINQLILKVRGASGEAVVEKLKIPLGDELNELGSRIIQLIERVNQTQDDLNRNKQLLQYSNKYAALGKVAPTIAHEIRNPLTAIKMLIYSIKEEKEIPESIQQDLKIISSEIDRMEEFIKNFLKFAKPADPQFYPVNPDEIVREVVMILNPKIRQSEINLFNNTTDEGWVVMADSNHLKQLFMNLILNAIEVTPKKGSITLCSDLQKITDVENKAQSKEYLRISIEDTGCGIPAGIMDNLFEPFVKGSEQGVGIGLSISQNIASMHNGWIEAQNKPDDQGAIFYVFLPIHIG